MKTRIQQKYIRNWNIFSRHILILITFIVLGEIPGEGGPEQQQDQLHRGGRLQEPRLHENTRPVKQSV